MTEKPAEIVIRAEDKNLDQDRFVSIWNIARATMGDSEQTRMLASKLIGFLCKHRSDFVVVSPSDAKYLDEKYERDNSLLNNWKPDSESVDLLTQHAHVQYDAFLRLIKTKKFSIEKNYSPTRANRLDWFTNDWIIG